VSSPALAAERFSWETAATTESLTGEPPEIRRFADESTVVFPAESRPAADSPPTMESSPDSDESYSGRLLKAVRSTRRDGK
jgi:hypothetical protein